jgi:hypothetical protein
MGVWRVGVLGLHRHEHLLWPVRDGLQMTYSVVQPTAGYYRISLVRGGVKVGIRIWHGPPKDPVTGEELDRSWRWQAEANGVAIDLDRVWPAAGRDPIDAAEYQYLTDHARWAERNCPDAPAANPHRKIDLLAAPLAF